MNKTYIYIIVLAALLSFAGYTFLKKHRENLAKEVTAFGVKNTDEVTKITLKDKEGNTMLLEKNSVGWILNEKHKANEQFVKEILNVFGTMYTFAPLAQVAQENAIKQMSIKSTKVEVYLKGKDTPEKVFYVGGVSPGKKGTNMLLEVDGKIARQVQEVRLHGFEGYVTDRFYIDESLWRDKSLFNFHSNDIAEVSIKYYNNLSNQSFTLINNNGSFTLQREADFFTNENLHADLITSYLLGFGKKTVEAFENNYNLKDSVIANMPFADLYIKDVRGGEVKMYVYFMPSDPKSKQQFDDEGIKVPYDVDRYFALVNEGKDFGVIQVYTFGQIFANPFVFIKNKAN